MSQPTANPYLHHYRSLGLLLTPELPFQHALLLTQQAALLHNTLGFVLKDLLQMISYKYSSPQFVQQKEPQQPIQKFRGMAQAPPIITQRLSIPEVPEFEDTNIKTVNYRRGGFMGSKERRRQDYDEVDGEYQAISLPVPVKRFYQNEKESSRDTKKDKESKDKAPIKRVSCGRCDRFYEVIGQDNPELCQCSSRHKKASGRASIVPDFDDYFQI